MFVSLTNSAPGGCGPDSGCEHVLSSRWAVWLGMPVSAAGVAMYAGMLLASVGLGRGSTPARRRTAWLVGLAVALTAGGAATWFVWLQAGVLRSFCPWCSAVHACGLALAVVVVTHLLRRRGPAVAPLGSGGVLIASAGALVALAALIGGQLLFPPASAKPLAERHGEEPYRAATGPQRFTAATVRGTLDVDLRSYPRLGPPDAPHKIVVLADYTCSHCRTLHGLLDEARARYKGQIAITVMPVPLDVKCNRLIGRQNPLHERACELATLALAVWHAAPAKFAEFDHWLFTPAEPPPTAAAEAKAAALIGASQLTAFRESTEVRRTLANCIETYRMAGGGIAGSGSMPKLILPGQTFHAGKTNLEDRQTLLSLLERELGVAP